MRDDPQRYLQHTAITDPKRMVTMFDDLPRSTRDLVTAIQGTVLHVAWAGRYGLELTRSQRTHTEARTVERMLGVIAGIVPAPLTVKRQQSDRFIGNCRDYSVLLTSILRSQGIPARARCGFGTYFLKDSFEDHWICEWWGGSRWIGVDAQIDDLQRGILGLDFDTLDVPHGKFLHASEAWQLVRSLKADPSRFGIGDMRGLWFIRGNLLRELAALNDAEMLPWDSWGLSSLTDDQLSTDDLSLLDEVASTLVAGSPEIHTLYTRETGLQVPTNMMIPGM